MLPPADDRKTANHPINIIYNLDHLQIISRSQVLHSNIKINQTLTIEGGNPWILQNNLSGDSQNNNTVPTVSLLEKGFSQPYQIQTTTIPPISQGQKKMKIGMMTTTPTENSKKNQPVTRQTMKNRGVGACTNSVPSKHIHGTPEYYMKNTQRSCPMTNHCVPRPPAPLRITGNQSELWIVHITWKLHQSKTAIKVEEEALDSVEEEGPNDTNTRYITRSSSLNQSGSKQY